MKKIVKVKCTIEIPFESYDKKKLNEKAVRSIKRWIRQTINEELSYIPLFIEKDDHGAFIEDTTGQTKTTIK